MAKGSNVPAIVVGDFEEFADTKIGDIDLEKRPPTTTNAIMKNRKKLAQL